MQNNSKQPFDLTGRSAVITGGTQGVGAAIATALANAGSDVVLVGLQDDETAQQTLASCRNQGVKADLLLADLSGPPDSYLSKLLQRVEEVAPKVDLLINNVGTYIDKPYLEMDYETYRTTMHLNVTSGYFLTQAIARQWVEDRVRGRILFTGSINGVLSEPDHTAYDTSKGAVGAMVRSLCITLAPMGIRVNALAPGLVRTPLTKVLDENKQLNSWMKLHTPNGQVPTADVCGGAAVFLLSDAAEHVQGQTLLVDGGMSVWQQPDPPDNWSA
ncbi:MAG: SDR family oxidoreductase [Rubripirellula sp.]|nr:oxidoreductase [Rhodopirellula sp.]MCH1441080.1 SDR family oxidoreductase [Rubripirellula sp.]OUX07533.1 MAG: oxidoreductase [Planctomycetaceae bacterium TMED240]